MAEPVLKFPTAKGAEGDAGSATTQPPGAKGFLRRYRRTLLLVARHGKAHEPEGGRGIGAMKGGSL